MYVGLLRASWVRLAIKTVCVSACADGCPSFWHVRVIGLDPGHVFVHGHRVVHVTAIAATHGGTHGDPHVAAAADHEAVATHEPVEGESKPAQPVRTPAKLSVEKLARIIDQSG